MDIGSKTFSGGGGGGIFRLSLSTNSKSLPRSGLGGGGIYFDWCITCMPNIKRI